MSDDLSVNFSLNNDNIEATFENSEGANFDALFEIHAQGVNWGYIRGDILNQLDLMNILNEKQDVINDLSTIRTNAQNGNSAYEEIQTYGNIVTHNISEFATAEQGALADSALQPNDNISELTNNVGYITNSALEGYATESYVQNQGYITGINSTDVTTALGFTPYNSTNPNGYQANVIENIKVNGTAQIVTDKAVNITVPTDTSDLTNNAGFITSASLPTVNNATLTIQKNSATIDTFTANASVDKIINISVPVNASDVGALPNSTKYGYSIDLSLNTTDYKLTLTLKDQDGTTLSTKTVDFPIESVVVNGSYDDVNQKIVLTLQNGTTIDIPVGALIAGLQTEITSSNKLNSDLVDDTNQTNKFVTTSEKSTWNGKQDTISDLSSIRTNATNGASAYTTISGYGNIVTHNTNEFATSTQGNKADSALQPNDNITQLTNNAGYITGITSSDVTTALGYTPYNSTNPDGYQTNVIETVKVNGTALTPTNKAVDVEILDYYGTCSTKNSTKAKVVVCPDFVLREGVSIRVKFTNAQSYNGTPTLNVNGTGAIDVQSKSGTGAVRYCWLAGEVVAFTYDGTSWIMEDAGIATTSYYGVVKLGSGATSTSTSVALVPSSLNATVRDMICPYDVYSSSATYAVGDRVRYDYNAWECNTAITGEGEAWTEEHWTALDPIQTQLDNKQATLVSGTNIKTINNESLLGSGNISITSGGTVDQTYDPTSANAQSGVAIAGAGFLTGITSSDVTTALGYTPYNSTNPNGYTSNIGTVTSVNNISPVSGNVTISIPSDTGDLTNNAGFITSSALSGYATETWVGNQGYITGISSSDVTNALGFTPVNSSSLATVATSGSYNDLSNKPTIPTVNNATLTIQKNGTTVKTFTANASSDVTANITVPTTASDVGALSSSTTINDLTTTAQQNALNSGATTTNIGQIATNTADISTINGKIPSAATSSNQLADKSFVNSSISTNTANFIGTFNSVADLEAYSGTLTNNDYAFVISTDSAGNTVYNRYKYTTATTPASWVFEYALNNSSFTSNQWAAINSGATTTNIALAESALQSGDNISELVNNSGYITGIDSSDVTTALGYTPVDSSSLATVATTGAYSDLTGTPTIPTVNNATLTIQKNGTAIDTFTANASSDVTVNITVPTNTNELTNGAGFITSSSLSDYIKKDSGSTTQTIALSSGTGTTALGLKSRATSSYISFSNTSGWIGSYGVSSDKKPTYYNGSSYILAYTSDIPTKTSDITNDSGYFANTATGSNSVTIEGTATSGTYSNNIGNSSSISSGVVGGNVFGYQASASANYGIAIGHAATASAVGAIQLGYGTNSTANSLSIGYRNSGGETAVNYQLLDTDGIIPDARISSNIARTSAIPDITNLANKSLSNLDTTGQGVIDGKADVDLSNINASQSAKETITAWGVADYSASVSMTNPYTCPKNGFVLVGGNSGQAQSWTITRSGTVITMPSFSTYPSDGVQVLFPVLKNDVITATLTQPFLFYPMKGV